MRRVLPGVLLLTLAALLGARALGSSEDEAPRAAAPAFRALDLWVDTGDAPLAAYQVELRYDRSAVKIVGLEGGEPDAYRDPPYHDRAGLEAGRIVLAALTTDDNAPSGRIRVARLDIFVEDGGETPRITLVPVTAARPGGERIEVSYEMTPVEGR
jgi:hypothetical protein